jgi:hypothetical protein
MRARLAPPHLRPETGYRYSPHWLEVCISSGRSRWLGRCGAYDLWYDTAYRTFTVVDKEGRHTDYETDNNGTLEVSDRDTDHGVRPELPDMCLIYARVKAYRRPDK